MLESFEGALRRCAGCHDQCLFATAEVFATGRQTLATSRKALLLLAVLRGDLPWSEGLAEVVYAGLGTGIQHAVCVYHGDRNGWPDETLYLRAARAELVRRGLAPGWAVAVRDRWRSTADPYGSGSEERATPGSVVFFFDASSRAMQPDALGIWIELARRLGAEPGLLSGGNAGFELADLGFASEAREAAADLSARLAALRPQAIVSDAPETVYTIRQLWPRWGVEPPAPVQHASEWLAAELGSHGVLRRPRGPRLTYQDPAYLARYLGVVDAPRETLARLGVRVVEMLRTKNEAAPSGSFFGDGQGDWVRIVAAERIASAIAAGAAGVVTASPFDRRNLAGPLPLFDLGQVALDRLARRRPRRAALPT